MAGTKRSCCNRFCCFSSSASDEEGQDHPASAGPGSLPSAIDNTTETLPGPPKRSEAPIPGSSDVVTPRKDEIEQHVDPNPDVSRTDQCDKAPLSESQNILRKFEGEGQDHPPSAGPPSSHSAIEGTHSVAPKNSEAPKCELEHVEANLNVSGPPHQCDKAQASASPNILQKSEDENVNVNKNVSRDPWYNETPPTASGEASKHDMRTKASISVSSNAVPKKYEVQHVDANLKAHQGDKAPSPSQSFNVPQRSEGANVNINQNVSAGPECSGTPSSSSPSEATKSDLLKTIVDQAEGKRLDVNIDDLMDHIYKLLKLREKEMLRHKKASNPSNFRWPEGFKKLNGILSCGTDLKNLTQLQSSGLDFASKLKEIISGPVKTLLREIGQASVATAGLLVIAYSLERFDELSTNKEKCWDILKEMSYLATVVTRLKQSRKGTQEDVIEETTLMIAEGAIMCCSQIASSPWNKFFLSSKNKADLSEIRLKLNNKYMQINLEIGFRVLTAIESKGMSPLSKKYPKDAVGMEKSIAEVLHLLECESDQKAVTVILHGFGGMGKTTLADAVFSHVGGCRYSHIQLFENIDSKPHIIELQKKILKDLMGPEEPVPDIRKYQDGQRELGERLEKIEAFIYIDNVLEGAELKQLLPQDMSTAKKVRLLLTARNEKVKNACPRPCTEPKIYKMEGIQHQEALIILQREIKDGINNDQFNDIIDTCGGIPLMLTLAAAFIGRAKNKEEAYSTLVLQKNKWPSEDFEEMRYAFAYDALPHDCIEPFLDICSYFKGWDWEAVEDIVGKYELEMLESRALVTRTTNDVASVHDVILILACQKSEGKEVRLAFTSASKLTQFLEDKGAEGIKGIWLSDNTDALQISAPTLDSMSKSLRVLRLGDLANVEGECRKTFKELLYFEANVRQLPFPDVSKLEKLRYLSYQPNDELKLSKMPSSLRHMEFDGTSLSDAFQIYSNDLQQLEHLRMLRLLNFSRLKNLPKKLGDQLKGLHELSLSNCRSITKLPDSISKLQSLRILKMDGCLYLTELPGDFGSLSSLRELHLRECWNIKALPDSAEKLLSLTLLDLSRCGRLLNLPPCIGNLTRLVELNLSHCTELKSIPEGIGELKLLRALGVSECSTLTELPDGLCNLSFITNLSFEGCKRLEKLPDGFGQLACLKVLSLTSCESLQKLPESFGQLACLKVLSLGSCQSLQKLPESFGQLKNLEVLDLRYCRHLRELCNDFHCLSSLQNLYMKGCRNLEKLPLDFHCLTSLQTLDLIWCNKLEGKSMDHVVKMNRLQVVHIKESKQLVDRWAEIQRDGGGSWSFTVISGQDFSLSRVEKENIEKSLLLELDGLLTNRRGEHFHLSHLPPNTLMLVTWELTSVIEEMIDEMQIRVIYIGPDFDKFSTKVKDNIFVVDVPNARATQMLEKVHLTLDLAPDPWNLNKYLQIDTRMQVGHEYRPCWRLLTESEMKEFVLSNCKRYLRLKEIEAERDEESSNIELLRELFAARGDEKAPVFQKNESSVQQDPTANSQVKATCGVDKLKGKTILLEMRPPDSFYDIRLPSLKEMYLLEKERLNFEIISIPLLKPRDVSYVIDVYKQFSREVPWLVLQNPWTTITREVHYFLGKQCTEWEEDNEDNVCEQWYPSVNWIIDPNGRITLYRAPISPGDMRDRGEVFKVFFNYLESESYQLRWGVNAPLTTLGKIEEVKKNEWQQLKNMSTLEFLFNHLESVSVQVKSLMRQGKFICFFSGSSANHLTWFMRSAMEQFRDSIHFIIILSSREYYDPLENTSEMEGTSLLNLSRHETVRFIMRLRHLEEEMNGMDQSDEQLCELKTILHSLLFHPPSYEDGGSFTFFNEVGKMVGALEGRSINRIFYESGRRRDKVQRLINSMLKQGGKEMHDEDSSLIKKMQTASAAAVEQQNADVYFDALRDYISELWEVQLYQLCKLNEEGKKRSPPRVTWPTSRGLCRLKNFLSEGKNEDWVKYVIFPYSEKDALNTVVKSLVKDIGEAEWAVAGLLAVADLLERFETVPSSGEEWLFVLEEMFRLAQYSKQFNQKAELWRRMKCGAIVVILRYSIICCRAIDPSKFALFRRWEEGSRGYKWSFFYIGRREGYADKWWLRRAEENLREEWDTLAQTMTEDLDNESGSLANLQCYKLGFDLWPEGEGEGGPSSEYKRSASCPDLCFPDLWLESEEEGGPSESEEGGEDEGGPSEGEEEGGPSESEDLSVSVEYQECHKYEGEDEDGPSSEYEGEDEGGPSEGEEEGGPSESEDLSLSVEFQECHIDEDGPSSEYEGGPSSEYKRSASFP